MLPSFPCFSLIIYIHHHTRRDVDRQSTSSSPCLLGFFLSLSFSSSHRFMEIPWIEDQVCLVVSYTMRGTGIHFQRSLFPAIRLEIFLFSFLSIDRKKEEKLNNNINNNKKWLFNIKTRWRERIITWGPSTKDLIRKKGVHIHRSSSFYRSFPFPIEKKKGNTHNFGWKFKSNLTLFGW